MRNITIILLPLLISTLSAWRFMAVFRLQPSGWPVWLTCFGLFWLMVWYITPKHSRTTPQKLTIITGITLFALAGLLLIRPAGWSKITLEIYASNVWSPNIFTALWSAEGGTEETPFTLPEYSPTPAKLEITATGQHNPASSGSDVWFVDAMWADNRTIPYSQFQAEQGWKRKQVNWLSYQNRTIWLSSQPQPATLRWEGSITSPLTLILAKHWQAGQINIRWNESYSRTVDLYASDVELKSITLPLKNRPVVWQADLPWTALQEDIGITIQLDPGGRLGAIFEKIKITGLPGQNPEVAGHQLVNALSAKNGWPELATGGVNFNPNTNNPLQLFLTGSLATKSNWSLRIIPHLENGLFILYLAVIGGLLADVIARLLGQYPAFLLNINLVLISLLMATIIGELGLRLYLPLPDRYYIWQPNLRMIFQPNSDAMPGIEGETEVIINSQGVRGDELPPQADYQILTIGGSSTEALYLDQKEAWPQLLQDNLNKNKQGLQVWVGNAGRSGRNSREHVLQAKYLLPQYPNLDAVIMLVGINDLGLRLEQGADYMPDYLNIPGGQQAIMKRAFDLFPNRSPAYYYQKTALWHLAGKVQQARQQKEAEEIIRVENQEGTGSFIIERRKRRQNSPIVDKLPDLSTALEEYSRNINAIIDTANTQGVRIILVTQPTMWRPDLTEQEKGLLWFGWGAEHKTFYSIEALIKGMAAYNNRVLTICNQRKVECLDLAKKLPQNSTIFYDDVHFNENGSKQTAKIISDYISGESPFTDTGN